MLSTNQLSMQYGAQTLFEDATLQCRPGNRYGLVGKNGAGKSTVLRVLAGEIAPTSGTIDLPYQAQVGILKQDHFQYETQRLLDVVIAGKPKLWAAIQEKEKIYGHSDFTEADGIRLGELEEIVMEHNGYEAESLAHTLLSGLGIEQAKHELPLSALSGGFKLRVLLAQVLFQEADILLLDEPTNHLDITTIHWLEEYLKNEYAGVLLFVSHDKHFLNSVSTHILDIDYGTIMEYTGNFDDFLFTKAQAEDQRASSRKLQEAKVAQLQTFVEKFGAKASKAKQARSKQRQIDKMEMTEIKVSNRGAPYFNFKIARPSGKIALQVKGISKAFGELKVLNNINFQVLRGEKIAIIGPNGMGKSTLLKILTQVATADEGEYEWGYETAVGYFAQDHHEQLSGEETVFNWLSNHAPPLEQPRIRSVLGQMLFSGSTVEKKISQLSGGEAARLLAGYLIINQPNVIIMDEPTNHLDLEAVNALSMALQRFPGTLMFVSHDRDFVRDVATRIIVLTPKGLVDITASYDDYLNAAGEDFLKRDKQPKVSKGGDNKKGKPEDPEREASKKANQLEREIAKLEQKLHTIDDQMMSTEFYEDNSPEDVAVMQKERDDLQASIEAKLTDWENLMNPM